MQEPQDKQTPDRGQAQLRLCINICPYGRRLGSEAITRQDKQDITAKAQRTQR